MVVKIPKSEFITIRLTPELKKAIEKEAARMHITKSEYMKRAALHYIHRSVNQDTLACLTDVLQYVASQLEEYVDVAEVEDEEIHDINYYLEKVYTIQQRKGYITDGLVTHYARLSGVTRQEFLEHVDGKKVTIM